MCVVAAPTDLDFCMDLWQRMGQATLLSWLPGPGQHTVCLTHSSPQPCPCSESPPASLDMCHCTGERTVLWFWEQATCDHVIKKPTNQKPTPKHTKPLIHYSYVAPTSNIHRSHTSDCTLEVLCNPRQGFSYARKKWKDGTVQIITEIVKNTITCILPVWPQLFYCWEMHLSKVKISHKPVFLPKAFVLSVLSSLIYLWIEQDLAQHMPATKWKTVTALSKPLSRLSTRMTVVWADCRHLKKSWPTGGPGTVC